jgi:outer membrane protein TolC
MSALKDMIKIIKKAFFKIIPLASLIAVLFTAIALSENISVNLNSAIDLAIENNESYLIAKKELDRANSQIMEAASGALPQITGGFTYLRNWRVPTGVFQFGDEIVTVKFGTDNSYTADLTLTQPLYSGGRTFAAIKIARLYRSLSREMVRVAGQDLKVEGKPGRG